MAACLLKYESGLGGIAEFRTSAVDKDATRKVCLSPYDVTAGEDVAGEEGVGTGGAGGAAGARGGGSDGAVRGGRPSLVDQLIRMCQVQI